ncbi:unnamed protein product [Prorocentrum cordatum]|uniref:Uncharacterized protein n=1 Tax=Prorocentrum cordatum TaxID=2364126 RepID=A0ABN9WDU8_9DINO|nr:unnamed protein product [Polarella glacialis]
MLLASLKGKAEEACEELDLDSIKGNDSVEVFLTYLGECFPEIEVLETPALLEAFVKPACVRYKFEDVRDYNNRDRIADDASISSEDFGDDLPDELQDALDVKEEQVAFFTKKMVRAKDAPRADIPRKGANMTNMTTNDGAGDAQEPHTAEMTVAPVYQHEQINARRARRQEALRQDADVPAEVTAAHLYIDKGTQCLMAATESELIYISVAELLKGSGGRLTFDTACSRCIGGLDWYNDIKKKMVTHTIKAALIPCSVNGKALTVKMSIVRSAVPGLFSRQAQSELDTVYHAGDNKLDMNCVNENDIEMSLSRAGHPTLDTTGFTPGYGPVQDVSDTKAEIRLHSRATYHAETAVVGPAKTAEPERLDRGVDASEADESQSESDSSELDSAELFQQQETSWGDNCSNTPTPKTSPPPAISSMRPPELQAEVVSYELDVRDATSDQLRVIVCALRAEGHDAKSQDCIPGLGKKLNPELQQLCRESNIKFNQRMTVPEQRQRLTGWRVEDAVSSSSDSVANPSSQIKSDHKMRFGRWVKAHGVEPLPADKARTTLEAVMAEEAVLDDECLAHAAITGQGRLEGPGVDTADVGSEKLGETDGESRAPPTGPGQQPPGKVLGDGSRLGRAVGTGPRRPGIAEGQAAQKPIAQHAPGVAQDVAEHLESVKEGPPDKHAKSIRVPSSN